MTDIQHSEKQKKKNVFLNVISDAPLYCLFFFNLPSSKTDRHERGKKIKLKKKKEKKKRKKKEIKKISMFRCNDKKRNEKYQVLRRIIKKKKIN